MSKRKSSSQTLQTADMTFEDDDFEDQQTESIAGDSNKGSGSRVSIRAKKAKAIYDPSEYNGPTQKRKKDVLEAQNQQIKTPTKTSRQSIEIQKPQTPVKSVPLTTVAVKAVEALSKPKIPAKRLSLTKNKTVIEETKTLPAKKSVPTRKSASGSIPPGPLVKEPSKRIQARKLKSTITVKKENNEPSTSTARREESPGSSNSSNDYDKASTIEFRSSNVPDVTKWTHQQVFEYFNRNLGFPARDAAVFKDEEIDGEALMIMKRSDIVTTKFQKLKLGTALKMWSQIIMFQTGSNDPTQAWK